MLKKGVNAARSTFSAVASSVEKFGSTIIMAMVLLTVTDIILRRFFNSPLPFSFELTEFLLVVVAYCYIAYTTSIGRHISVDTITSHFPQVTRKRVRTAGDFITIILFGLIAWQNVLQGMNVLKLGTTTAILHIPKFPFQFIVAIGSALACLVLLFTVLNSLLRGTEK